jgi:hypothetical protein
MSVRHYRMGELLIPSLYFSRRIPGINTPPVIKRIGNWPDPQGAGRFQDAEIQFLAFDYEYRDGQLVLGVGFDPKEMVDTAVHAGRLHYCLSRELNGVVIVSETGLVQVTTPPPQRTSGTIYLSGDCSNAATTITRGDLVVDHGEAAAIVRLLPVVAAHITRPMVTLPGQFGTAVVGDLAAETRFDLETRVSNVFSALDATGDATGPASIPARVLACFDADCSDTMEITRETTLVSANPSIVRIVGAADSLSLSPRGPGSTQITADLTGLTGVDEAARQAPAHVIVGTPQGVEICSNDPSQGGGCTPLDTDHPIKVALAAGDITTSALGTPATQDLYCRIRFENTVYDCTRDVRASWDDARDVTGAE